LIFVDKKADKMEVKDTPETIKYTNDFSDQTATDAAQLAALEGRSQRSWQRRFVRRNGKRIIAVVVVVLLAVGVGIWQLRKNNSGTVAVSEQKPVTVEIPAGSDHVFVNDVSGASTSDSKPVASDAKADQGTPAMGSENYKLKEVTFGTGSVAMYSSETESQPLMITDVHSEVMSGNSDADVKLLVTWKTDKLARAMVKYDKGGASRTLTEGGYGFSHALVLADLERATRYTFNIVGTDRWGNKATSDTFNAYIGKKNASVFELIAQQFSDMFGWARRK
jgi:hypothetical protein